ncbi:tRNA pseudouridine(38-40) synthase TruA (plasmid) [Pedobacter sp. BS3]|uniref:tRNA pseudouridine(38-40) synthase TruA n=1 Tax=Pedobacter sp. BS3 TaxID=2567937 RepID=UPI0011EF002C|nr:tRNA pseudouridine(38-40) synthase TruA [Pedobacter sp. BS3]TZF86400.1 tRNA pseudouridine(38-40) synthase TruA [Pedobacter sp. BS3]
MNTIRRYFAEICFKGTQYHGWQVQPNAVTVQQVLNQMLNTVFRQTVETVGCGRTDAGVHATQFYVHFDVSDVDMPFEEQRSLNSLNALLPYDIAVKRLIPVKPDAHARFDATLRSYEYRIHFEKDPFKKDLSWQLRDRPDIAVMNKASAILQQYRDFSCFSKSNTQVFTNNCMIKEAVWREQADGIVFYISADRFLRNMVRAIVGTLLEVGRGEMAPEALHDIIMSKDRSNAGTSVPACGLYLTAVHYPYIESQN